MEKRNLNGLDKSDIDTIIKVNNKAIELQTEVSDQYEELISNFSDNLSSTEKSQDIQTKILDEIKEIKKEVVDINKLQFRILLLLSTGMISLIIQVITLLVKK